MATGTVRLHRVFKAKPERVYKAFLDADALAKWLPPYGFTCKVHHLEAKVGGTFKMSFHNFSGGGGHSFGGEYLELDRPRRLVFTWRTPPLTESSRVIIEIAPQGDGCELTLTHEMDQKWAAFVDRAAGSWQKMADTIATLVEGKRH